MPKKNERPLSGRQDVVGQLLRDWKRERPDLDASAMSVVGRILHLGNVLEAGENAALRELKISYSDLDVLATLRRSGAPFQLTPSQLRHSVLLTSGAMTACLNRLEKAGLVRRVLDDADRRSLAAALTALGISLIDEAIVARFARAEEAVANLRRAERTLLAELLQKLCAPAVTPKGRGRIGNA
jgi:DNA-binding MarR family transcriptional regulator